MPIPRVMVPIQLDRPRVLCMSFNALCKAEEVTGMSFLVGEPAFSSMRVMRALVWAGLLHEDPSLTIEKAGDLIEGVGADKVLGAIMDAYTRAMPDFKPEEDDAEASDPPNPQRGGLSGQSDDTISD